MMPIFQKLVRRGFLVNCPPLIKSVAKIFVRSEAVYDKHLLKLGLDRICPTDTFLCSFPKSGNTWLRFLIGNLFHPNAELTFRNIDRYVPEVNRCPFDLNGLEERPILKTHWPFFSYFPRAIYIHRDPRDVHLSYFHYCVANRWFEGTYSEFIRSEDLKYYGTWNDHVVAAYDFAARYPGRILILKYEELLRDANEQAAHLTRFLGLGFKADELRVAVEKSSFEKLREMEESFGPETDQLVSGFFRKGTAGQWIDACSRDDVRFVEATCGTGMLVAGYKNTE